MIVVGVGVGPNMLTQEAIDVISNAPVVYGSKRSIELVEEFIKCEAHIIKDYKNLHLLPEDAVVLSTGDPMFSGLGKFATEKDRVVTGVSSVQAACARFHVDMSTLAIITAHGRDPAPAKEALIREVGLNKNIFLLPAENFGVKEVGALLRGMGVTGKLHIYENIGYPDERAASGTMEEPPVNTSDVYCIMVVQ
ncbi:precorrin-6Y C5,15-methyltransferase (decarboxylating) [Methanolobus vulcani]|jgi:cobalt-precorrin-7 (C5)-methyltransferase|uniref:Precorrin-6Y C5,15-methyltransferase (Decarboxylating) n=1 Tax=Methanolobus vulcani TaxID=38026 RepID=A0A7Z7FBS6_9EURY|nr:cobalt-precorrin-7 (C(5))-methyltransferase [Methanolobus vulcani]MDK2947475.1 cobalt-precorrin-7 (C5)-methyltransferase [Methanolobus sp.]SDF46356.1 precorrin-6Y C5,15-methyltransferase (decarboxylating) [Methanolobus vulcani]